MLPADAKLVEAPTFFPYACTSCGGQKGPLLDMAVERPTAGGIYREYVCRSCWKDGTKIFGFAKGEQMDRLAGAADALEESEKILEALRERLGVLDEAVKVRDSEIATQAAELDKLRGRVSQYEFLAGQLRNQADELAGVG